MRATATQLREGIDAAGGDEYPIVMELDSQPSWWNFMRQNGGGFVSPDAKTVGIGLPESADAVQQMVDLMDNGQMAPYTVLSETKGTDIFVSGKAGIVFIGSWKASVLENSSLGETGHIRLVQMPSMKVDNASVLGGLGYAIATNSKHPEQAWEFVKYITSFDAMSYEAQKGIDIPVQIEAQKFYLENFKNLNAQVITDAAVTGWSLPNNGNWEYMSYLNDAVALALSGMKPVQEALEEGAAAAQAVLDEYFAEQ